MLWRGWPSPLALLLLAGVATACRGRAPAAAPPPPSDEAVRALLKRRITAAGSKALVVGIIDLDGKRRVIAEAAPGLRAVDGATVLEMRSITKGFTAALLAGMVERGEVKLGDRIWDADAELFFFTVNVSVGSLPGHVPGRRAISGVDPGRVRRCGLRLGWLREF